MDKRWKKLDNLASKCYTTIIQPSLDMGVWDEAFLLLVEIIHDGRKRDGNFAPELYQLEESIDYRCDISGLLEDYMDELELREQYDKLQKVCKELINLFKWEEDSPSDLYFRIGSALREQGKYAEALSFCEEWYEKDPEDILAATSLIYARTQNKDFTGAEQIVGRLISEDTACTDDNDIVFTAAAALYDVSGNEKAAKRVSQAIEKYEAEVEAYFSEMDDADMGLDMLEEDLPFN